MAGNSDLMSGGWVNTADAPRLVDRLRSRRASRILTRSLTGRSNAVSAASNAFNTGAGLSVGLCQHQRVVLASHFDAVRIAIPNMHTSAVSSVLAAIGVSNAMGAWASAAPSANNTGQDTATAPAPTETVSASPGTFVRCTFAGASSVTLPAARDATNLVPSYAWSDWVSVSSVDRIDAGSLPIVDVRLFIPAAAGSITLAYTGASNNAWATAGREDLYTGGRAYRAWNQDVDGVTTIGDFTETTTAAMVVPILIQYLSRKEGATVLSVGDSIYEATSGATYPADNFVLKSVLELSRGGYPLEYCSINAAGGTTRQLLKRAEYLIDDLAPGIIFAQSASKNNFGSSLGTRVQQEGRGTVGALEALSARHGSQLIVGSMFPLATAANAWGATDAQRVSLNSWIQQQSKDRGFVFCDFGPVVDGPTDNGQVQPITSRISGDGIHFNDEGQNAMKLVATAAIASAMI